MANIPPMFSTSPPPLNITYNPEDFMDVVSDDYKYCAMSDQEIHFGFDDSKKIQKSKSTEKLMYTDERVNLNEFHETDEETMHTTNSMYIPNICNNRMQFHKNIICEADITLSINNTNNDIDMVDLHIMQEMSNKTGSIGNIIGQENFYDPVDLESLSIGAKSNISNMNKNILEGEDLTQSICQDDKSVKFKFKNNVTNDFHNDICKNNINEVIDTFMTSNKLNYTNEIIVFQDSEYYDLNGLKANIILEQSIQSGLNLQQCCDSNSIKKISVNKNDYLTNSNEDFGDFNSFISPSSLEGNAYSMLKIFSQKMSDKNSNLNSFYLMSVALIKMMFPRKEDEKFSPNAISRSAEICAMKYFKKKQIESFDTTKFQWKNSQIYDRTLSALNIDTRNIMFAFRCNNGISRFKSNWDGAILELLMPAPLTNSSASLIAESISSANNNDNTPCDWAVKNLENSFVGVTNNDVKQTTRLWKLKTENIENVFAKKSTSIPVLSDFAIVETSSCDKCDREDISITSLNKMTAISFNLPESHIFTVPNFDLQEHNDFGLQKNNTSESLQQNTNDFFEASSNILSLEFDLKRSKDNNCLAWDNILPAKKLDWNDDLKHTKKSRYLNDVSESCIDVLANNRMVILNKTSDSSNQNVNLYKSSNKQTNVISECLENEETFENSFTDYQSYKNYQEVSRTVQRTTTLIQDSFLTQNKSNESIQIKLQPSEFSCHFDDSQAEWSDFVSINNISSSSKPGYKKNCIDMNVFKVPIQFHTKTIENTLKEKSCSLDLDDWSDFVSSTPVSQCVTSGFNKVESCDKWKRAST